MTEEKKTKSGAGKFFLGAALGAIAGAIAGKFISVRNEEECDCGEDCECGDDCDCEKEVKKPAEKTDEKKTEKK